MPIWLVIQAMRAKKSEYNQLALATAQNTFMLYSVNADTSKIAEEDRVTVANFLPYPDIYEDEHTVITLNISRGTARRILASYPKAKSYVKFAIAGLIKELKIIARK